MQSQIQSHRVHTIAQCGPVGGFCETHTQGSRILPHLQNSMRNITVVLQLSEAHAGVIVQGLRNPTSTEQQEKHQCRFAVMHSTCRDLRILHLQNSKRNINAVLQLCEAHEQLRNLTSIEQQDKHQLSPAVCSWCKAHAGIKVCVCDHLFSLYLKMSASFIESFLVLGFHCNNVIGAQNRICSIECSCLHHIFYCHTDSAELSERLSCWNLKQLPVKFCSLCYSRCHSNHR